MALQPPILISAVAAIGAALGPVMDLAVERLPRHRAPQGALATAREGQAVVDRAATVAAGPNDAAGLCGAECRQPMRHRRLILATAGAALFAAVAARGSSTWAVVPQLALIAALLPLALCDLEHLLLPRTLVRLGLGAVGTAILSAAAATGDWRDVRVAVICSLVAGGALAAISLMKPGWLGFGDSRLGVLIGLGVGWMGPGPLVLGFLVANLACGLFGVGLLVARRAQTTTALPYGVFLAGGAIVAVLVAG